MNHYLNAVNQSIALHGETCSYISVTTGAYDVNTGAVTNTETTSSITAYLKHMKASQYNYPNLIGKDIVLFYISASSLLVPPEPNDRITTSTAEYTVDSFQEHRAGNAVVMYKVLGVKG